MVISTLASMTDKKFSYKKYMKSLLEKKKTDEEILKENQKRIQKELIDDKVNTTILRL